MPDWSRPPEFGDLTRHLAEVETDIGWSEHRIAELRALVADLRESGHGTADAEVLLSEAELVLGKQRARRDAIVRLIEGQ